VEINLRLPSMLHGKKGFERIVSAFTNVVNRSVSWLFCDLASPSSLLDEGLREPEPEPCLGSCPNAHRTDAPIKKHCPQILAYTPTQTTISNVLVPPLSLEKLAGGGDRVSLRDSCHEIQELLALISLDSPRIRADDTIDPYFSRYAVPNREECKASSLVKVTWRGLLHPAWLMRLLAGAL
jgi:ribonuclease P/MRP protein subunit RPP40